MRIQRYRCLELFTKARLTSPNETVVAQFERISNCAVTNDLQLDSSN